jgi:hypothetical protein
VPLAGFTTWILPSTIKSGLKTNLLFAGQFMGQGKTYLGRNAQKMLRKLVAANGESTQDGEKFTLPEQFDLEAFEKAHYVMVDAAEHSTPSIPSFNLF